MAHACTQFISDVAPDDIEVARISVTDQLTVWLTDDGGLAGSLYIAGDSDAERVANLRRIGEVLVANADALAATEAQP